MRDAVADGLDDASQLAARRKRQRRLHLVFVLHDEQVGKVQARSADGDPNLPGLRLGSGHFFPDKGLDANGILTKPSMHD